MAHSSSDGLPHALAFYKEALRLKAEGKLPECCGHLLEGLRTFCQTDEERVPYFSVLSEVLPHLEFEDYILNGVFVPTSPQFWSNVLRFMAANNNWPGVLFYTLGFNRGHMSPLEGLASNAPTHGIRISGLLTHLSEVDLKAWGIPLAIWLLEKGAPVDGIAVDDREPVAVAVVKCAIRADNNDLFQHVMNTSSKVRLQIDRKNKNGDAPLHILVKSGKIHSLNRDTLLKLLLHYGASANVRDAAGKLPIDYLDSKMSIYSHLQRAGEIDLKLRIKDIRERGNKCLQQGDSFEALRSYKEAIALTEKGPIFNQDLAVLHTNCSIVNARLGLYKDALESAKVAVECDQTYFKVFPGEQKCSLFI